MSTNAPATGLSHVRTSWPSMIATNEAMTGWRLVYMETVVAWRYFIAKGMRK